MWRWVPFLILAYSWIATWQRPRGRGVRKRLAAQSSTCKGVKMRLNHAYLCHDLSAISNTQGNALLSWWHRLDHAFHHNIHGKLYHQQKGGVSTIDPPPPLIGHPTPCTSRAKSQRLHDTTKPDARGLLRWFADTPRTNALFTLQSTLFIENSDIYDDI